MPKPVASHRRAVAHRVEFCVINRGCRREVQDDDGNFRTLHDGQHGRRQRVSRDVQENNVHVRLAEFVAGLQSLFWIVNETKIHDLDAGTFEFFLDSADVAFETRLESLELRPVSVEADAEKSDAKLTFHFNLFYSGGL